MPRSPTTASVVTRIDGTDRVTVNESTAGVPGRRSLLAAEYAIVKKTALKRYLVGHRTSSPRYQTAAVRY